VVHLEDLVLNIIIILAAGLLSCLMLRERAWYLGNIFINYYKSLMQSDKAQFEITLMNRSSALQA
jgi:hypothetical protein